MTAGGKAETLANAIRHLGEPEWQHARKTEIAKNLFEQAYAATREAIMGLPPSRWLTVSEVAVLLHCVETTAFRRLDEFKTESERRNKGKAKDYRVVHYKIARTDPIRGPNGSELTRVEIKAIEAKRALNVRVIQRWEYRREAVLEWWNLHERKAPKDGYKKQRLESPTQRLRRELEALTERFDRLECLVKAKVGWLTKDGVIFDNADLPQAPVEDIRAFLADGGSIESMTLGEAMMSRTWLGYGYREPWAALWKRVLTEAIAATDQAALAVVSVAGGREHRSRS